LRPCQGSGPCVVYTADSLTDHAGLTSSGDTTPWFQTQLVARL